MECSKFDFLAMSQKMTNARLMNSIKGNNNPKTEKNPLISGLIYGDIYAQIRAITAIIFIRNKNLLT